MPKLNIKIPEHLRCPLSKELFLNPVFDLKEKHVYDITYIKNGGSILTTIYPDGHVMSQRRLTPAFEKKNEVEKFLESNGICTFEEFLDAIKENNFEEIIKLNYLDSHLKFKDISDNHQSALHYAAKNNNVPLIHYLIENGAPVDIMTDMGRTPLYFAVQKGNIAAATALLDQGATLYAKDTKRSVLALCFNGKEMMNLLISKAKTYLPSNQFKEFLSSPDERGRTLLYFLFVTSFSKEAKDTVKILLDAGADVNVADNEGLTPLHLAMINTRNDNYQEVMVDMLNGNYQKVMIDRLNGNYQEVMVDMLLAKRANVDAQDQEGETPFHKLVKRDRPYNALEIRLIKKLLQANANVQIKDKNGNRPLSYLSVKKLSDTILNILREKGVSIVPRNRRIVRVSPIYRKKVEPPKTLSTLIREVSISDRKPNLFFNPPGREKNEKNEGAASPSPDSMEELSGRVFHLSI